MKNKLNIEEFDRNDYIGMLKSFPKQIHEVVNIKDLIINYKKTNQKFNKILVCGMGGSAIGGDTVKSIILNKDWSDSELPIYINRDYSIPGWVDSDTFIILSSYSGNTEETISCYKKSIASSATIVIMTSGGELLEFAKDKSLPYALIPKGYMPRQALGYSVSIILRILNQYNMIKSDIIKDLAFQVNILEKQSNEYSLFGNKENKAIDFSSQIYNRFNIIYTSQKMEVIGLRFRAQLAENAKVLSSHFVFPEQNHNEIEAFQNLYLDNINIIWIDDISNHEKISKRMSLTKQVLKNVKHLHISFNDPCLMTRNLKLINFLDWVSYYSAIYNETNPYPVNVISELKDLL